MEFEFEFRRPSVPAFSFQGLLHHQRTEVPTLCWHVNLHLLLLMTPLNFKDAPPMIDREFGTIDFFVVFDAQAMSSRYRRMFS